MDPLQPIAPVSPSITPITPAPMIGGVNRNGGRSGAEHDKRRRQRPQADGESGGLSDHDLDYADEYPGPEADVRPHIDVTA
jgi:hypothetical protein